MGKRKGQEEVMGFVVIVLVVIIIGIAFFAFTLRQRTIVQPKQPELDDFINSMLIYTTNCTIGRENKTIRELIQDCSDYPSKSCQQGQNVCDFLNNTLQDMLLTLLGSGEQIANAYIHGYVLNITAEQPEEQIIYIGHGNLAGNYFASAVPIPIRSGNAWVSLKFYYSKE